MSTIESPRPAGQLQTLPTESAARFRQLQRIVAAKASIEAASALRAAATRARDDESILASALAAADAVLSSAADDAARDRLSAVATSHRFMTLIRELVAEMRWIASSRPDSGACAIGSALDLWQWTMEHFSGAAAVDEVAELLAPILAARCLAIDSSDDEFRSDLSQVYSARMSAAVGAACAEVVFGYRRHMVWDAEGCGACYESNDLDDLEAVIPGIASGACVTSDIIEADGSHPAKRGPCAGFEGVETFTRLRRKLDGCLTGARIAKDRAAAVIERTNTTGRA